MYGEENGSLSTYNDGVWKEGYSDADNVYIQSSGDKDDYTSRETKSVEDVEPILAEQIAAFEASH